MSQSGSLNSINNNPSVATQYDADVGVAIPAANILNVIGGSNITVSGSGNTLVITNTGSGGTGITTLDGNSGNATGVTVNVLGAGSIVTSAMVDTVTISLTGLTNHAVLVGAGTNTITKLAVGSNGQVLLGATAADPAFGTLTSTGGTITFTTGVNSLNLEAGASIPTTFDADTGSASPALNILTLAGSGSIVTSASGSTVTTALTGLTNHAVLVGAGTSTITKVGPTATAGQVLQSAGSSADPAFSTATYPSTTTINQLLYSSSNNVVAGLATANRAVITTTSAGVPVATALAVNGQLIIGSTAGAPAAATLTAGTGISISNGSNSITISATAAIPLSFPCDSGTATPAANALTLAGSGSITTTGSGATATFALQNLTNHAVLVGAGTSTMTKLTVGSNGQVLIGATGADPAFANLTSTGGTITFTTGVNTLNLEVNSSLLLTLSDDVGTSITPSASNIQLKGHVVNAGGNFSTVVAGSHLANINPMTTARWIVDALGFNGTHTTIASAITSATAGETIYILTGTYTEDLVLKSGVNLCAYECDALTPNVTIVGKNTFTAAGTVSISGIQLKTNSDFLLAVTGSAASIVNLENCYLNCSNHSGVSLTSSSGSSRINIISCNGDLGTTGINYIGHSGAGNLLIDRSYFTNTGGSSTASTLSGSGIWLMYYTFFNNLVTTSSTANGFTFLKCIFDCGSQNATVITQGCTNAVGASLLDCWIGSGSGSAISVSAGCNLNASNCTINCSNTNAITGSGTLTYQCLMFTGSSSLINTTTQSGGLLKGGLVQAPSAGFIGEQISSAATAVSASNGTGKTVTSISVTAGVWNISAQMQGSGSGAVLVGCHASISTVTNTFQGNDGDQVMNTGTSGASTKLAVTLADFRVVLTATTTYYLVGILDFGSGTATFNGRISATRVG